jgi:multiple sugar transport system substrate-binding protein
MAKPRSRISRRKLLQIGAGSLFIPFSLKAGKAPAQGGKKPFEGVTLNISCWSATYPKLIADYLPEFTEKTGIKVNYDTPGFPVYNQRADLELSTKGSGFDVLNVTFIYTSRWIGAGWLTPLYSYIKDFNKTPADWDFADFVSGSVQPMKDKAGAVYGVPWISDVLMAASARFDILKANGLGMPDSFDELDKAMQVVNKKEGVAARSSRPRTSVCSRRAPRDASRASHRTDGASPWAPRTRTRLGSSSNGRCPKT